MHMRPEPFFRGQGAQTVGKLNFAARAGFGLFSGIRKFPAAAHSGPETPRLEGASSGFGFSIMSLTRRSAIAPARNFAGTAKTITP